MRFHPLENCLNFSANFCSTLLSNGSAGEEAEYDRSFQDCVLNVVIIIDKEIRFTGKTWRFCAGQHKFINFLSHCRSFYVQLMP